MAVAMNIPVPKPRDMSGNGARGVLSQSLPTEWDNSSGLTAMSGLLQVPGRAVARGLSLSSSLPKQSPGPPHPTPLPSPGRKPAPLHFLDLNRDRGDRDREQHERPHRRSMPPLAPPSTPTALVPPRARSNASASSSRAVAGSPAERTGFFDAEMTAPSRRRRHSVSTTTGAERSRSPTAHVNFCHRAAPCPRGCDDHEHAVGPGGEALEYCVTGRCVPSHRTPGRGLRGVLAKVTAQRSALGSSCVEPALRDRLLARRATYTRLPPHHRPAHPNDNLYAYLARATIPAWDKWPHPVPVDPSYRRRRISLGLARRDPLGLEWTRRRTDADARRGTRALSVWEPVAAWDCEVLSYMEDYVPATPVEVVDKARQHTYVLEADGFKTSASEPLIGANDEQRLLSWFTSTILRTAVNVVHALRVKSANIDFNLVCAAPTNGPHSLHEGYGTLVLMNTTVPTERCMLVSVRPPSVYDSGTMREFARGIHGWWQFDDVEGQRGQANLLQAQIYDECTTNQVYFWVVTTVSHWVFGQFNMNYTRCSVSPVLSRDQHDPGVLQSLVSWMLRAVDELSTRKDPCRLARRNSAPSRMQEEPSTVAVGIPAPAPAGEVAVVGEREKERRKRHSAAPDAHTVKSSVTEKKDEEKDDAGQREAERDRARERRRLRRDAKLGPRQPLHASATVMGMNAHAYAHAHPHSTHGGYHTSNGAVHDGGQVVYYPYPVTVAQQPVPYQYYWYTDPMVLC